MPTWEWDLWWESEKLAGRVPDEDVGASLKDVSPEPEPRGAEEDGVAPEVLACETGPVDSDTAVQEG
jgi:hypothetical protein